MTTKTKVARRCGNNNRAFEPKQAAALGRSKQSISRDYDKGVFIVGIITAIAFGLIFIHAAVML